MHRSDLRKKWIILLKINVLFLFAMLCLAVSVPQAFAHKVIVIAYTEGDTVFVESGFDDGTVCNNASIKVFDPSDKKLLQGITDEEGKFSFKPPQRTDLRLVLDAGMGHRAECIVKASELPELTSETPKSNGDTKAIDGINAKEIELIVDKVMEKRLRPLIQMVAKSQLKAGFSLNDIFGGIGYLFGLMGICMYFKYRKGDRT